MTLNPQSRDTEMPVARKHPIFRATVISTPVKSGPDGKGHAVAISPEHTDQDMPALVAEQAYNDVSLPTSGSNVLCLIGQNETTYVIGTIYEAEESVQTVPVGDRVIGHDNSDSTVRFKSDGTVVINDGSTAPITDIETTKDNDGHVTSIDITRATDVLVPSSSP